MKLKLFLLLAFCISCFFDISAQCPMCRMTMESNMRNGGNDGVGLNAGILSLLAMPYLIVGGIAFVWWKNRKKNEIDLLE